MLKDDAMGDGCLKPANTAYTDIRGNRKEGGGISNRYAY